MEMGSMAYRWYAHHVFLHFNNRYQYKPVAGLIISSHSSSSTSETCHFHSSVNLQSELLSFLTLKILCCVTFAGLLCQVGYNVNKYNNYTPSWEVQFL